MTPLPEPNAERVAGEKYVLKIGHRFEMSFSWCPPGSFTMGGGNNADENPAHTVVMKKGYFIGTFEVTEDQWDAFKPSTYSTSVGTPVSGRPFSSASYEDAGKYCENLTQRVNNRVHFMLPTEAEWEYACRAGSTTKYSFGDVATDANLRCRWGELRDDEGHADRAVPSAIGSYPPNAWGIYDMHGNVGEVCNEKYRRRAYQDVGKSIFDWQDGFDANKHNFDLMLNRGGSLDLPASDCTSTRRGTSFRSSGSGFRIRFYPDGSSWNND
jgi:formylglycine-generating enzyme required for sulfatase activity